MAIFINFESDRRERTIVIIKNESWGISIDTKSCYMTDEQWEQWKFTNIDMKPHVNSRWINRDSIAIIIEKKGKGSK